MHKCQWGEFSCTRQTGHLKLNSPRNGWIVRTTTGGWICCWANMGLFNCTCCAGQLQEHIKEKGIIVSTFAGQKKVQIGAIVATGVYEQLFKITIWFIRVDCWSAWQIYASVQITSRGICRCEIWGAGDEGGAGVQSCRCKCTVVETPGQARGATLCAGKEVPPA